MSHNNLLQLTRLPFETRTRDFWRAIEQRRYAPRASMRASRKSIWLGLVLVIFSNVAMGCEEPRLSDRELEIWSKKWAEASSEIHTGWVSKLRVEKASEEDLSRLSRQWFSSAHDNDQVLLIRAANLMAASIRTSVTIEITDTLRGISVEQLNFEIGDCDSTPQLGSFVIMYREKWGGLKMEGRIERVRSFVRKVGQ